MSFTIREIRSADNQAVFHIITSVLQEFEAPKTGTALADPELFDMAQAYKEGKRQYFVAESNGKILGCCGVGPLSGAEDTAELQKMYVLPEARKQGIAQGLIATCLETARGFGYRQIYLETFTTMQAAQKLYLRNGFRYLDKPLGSTGHTSCPVWMLLDL